MDGDNKDLFNIIVHPFLAISSQMLGPTGLKKKKVMKWSSNWFWHSFADMCLQNYS